MCVHELFGPLPLSSTLPCSLSQKDSHPYLKPNFYKGFELNTTSTTSQYNWFSYCGVALEPFATALGGKRELWEGTRRRRNAVKRFKTEKTFKIFPLGSSILLDNCIYILSSQARTLKRTLLPWRKENFHDGTWKEKKKKEKESLMISLHYFYFPSCWYLKPLQLHKGNSETLLIYCFVPLAL